MTKISITAEDHHLFMMYGFLKGMLSRLKTMDTLAYKETIAFLAEIEPQLKPHREDKYHPEYDDLK